MKKNLLSSLLGVTALFSAAIPSYGQGIINLNNYASSGNQITYGAGSGVLTGLGLRNGPSSGGTWTIGFYYALGDVTGSVSPDATGQKDPSTLGGGLAFATGAVGDTTTINNTFGVAGGGGYFATPTGDAIINGWTAGSVTFEVVAYNGAAYASSTLRGHSAAFLLTPVAAGSQQTAPFISTLNGGMPGFAIFVPEPTTFGLAGIGAALFLAVRCKRRI